VNKGEVMKYFYVIMILILLGACSSEATETNVQDNFQNSGTLPEFEEVSTEFLDDNAEELLTPEVQKRSIRELQQNIDFSSMPTLLQGIRFLKTGSEGFTNEVHVDDGRNFPVGSFIAYYLTGQNIEIKVQSRQPIYEYELHYAHAYRLAKTIGQLPLSLQTSIEVATLIVNSNQSLSLNDGLLIVGEYQMNQLRDEQRVFTSLIELTGLSNAIDLSLWQEISSELGFLEIEQLYWESMSDQDLSPWFPIFVGQGILIHQTHLSAFGSVVLPPNDVMNISTLGVSNGLIRHDDPSTLAEVVFVENGIRYHARGENWSGYLTGPFRANVFEARYLNGGTMNIVVEASIEFSTAEQVAQKVGFIYGQAPDLLRAGMRDFIMLPGMGHPSSGPVTTFYLNVFYGMGNRVEEGFIHDMGHASLDWPARNATFDIIDNRTLIPHPGVTSRNEWLNAARIDNYYVSTYANDNPEREDIAESIMHYLIVRWRPERFDPYLIKFIENAIPNRIAYLDTFEFGYPEDYENE
jgi:hypothetical protein